MINPGTLFASLLLFASVLNGAPLERDLGKGLVYFRISETNRGLPDATLNRSCVLDLRYAPTAAVEIEVLMAWLKRHASPRTPVFALANADTAPALRQVLSELAPHLRLLVIGPAAKAFHPDIVITISAEAERRAYDALSAETDIATLITPVAPKPRHDEAAIMEARDRGESLDDETEPELTDDNTTVSDAPPVDLTLQRAVHLHRAWLILGAGKS